MAPGGGGGGGGVAVNGNALEKSAQAFEEATFNALKSKKREQRHHC